MRWNKIMIQTVTEAEDIIICMLEDIGLEGAMIEDKVPLTPLEKEQMFVDIPPVEVEDDGIAYLSFFVEDEEGKDVNAIVEEAKAVLDGLRETMDIGTGTITLSQTEDIDWINNWKKYFHQFTIDDLLVVPSWEDVKEEDKGKKLLRIDPGTAFGTGMHETTQLCIRAIKKYLTNGASILDVGTGSGILGIVALMYGADHIKATDLDPMAVEAVEDNLNKNNTPKDKFELKIGNIIDDDETKAWAGEEKYDIIVANILHFILKEVTPNIKPYLKEGGIYITSGIIEDKEDYMLEVLKDNGMEVLEVNHQGEWVGIVARA
ncbi:MAG: 50S ribosomal protein L11 methyltransferase [Lachnospiraceae bacterium]|nr:50S ribosomal protein L11 methyltransferase [Lachnospiraceae bacterium]